MAVPATIGQLRTRIEDMEIGDYIRCIYSPHGKGVLPTSSLGILGYLGSELTASNEVPLIGQESSETYNEFYLVKTKKGLLVSDRVCQTNISWDYLNQQRLIQGRRYQFTTEESMVEGGYSKSNIIGVLRTLTGGVAYADENGNSSPTDQGYGAFPTNNEWDKYIVNFPPELIQEGKTLDDVFHWSGVATWTQDTPITLNSARMCRGNSRGDTVILSYASSGVYANRGFRPVFAFQENE